MIYILIFSTSILWLWLFKRIAGVKKWHLLLQGFLTGCVLAPAAGLLNGLFVNLHQLNQEISLSEFMLHFTIVGPIEEMVKIAGCSLVFFRAQQYGNRNEFILTGVSVALGFAAVENLFYLKSYGLELTWPRVILGNLGHSGYAMLWSYAFTVCILEQVKISFLVGAGVYAALFHGAYNYLLTFSIVGAVIAILLTLCLAVLLFVLLKFESSDRS